MSNVIIYDTYNVNVTIENDEVVGVQVVEGFIHDVIAGTNITIDKTDPLNPIISAPSTGVETFTPSGETTAQVGGVDIGTDLGTTPILIQDLFDRIFYADVAPSFGSFSISGQSTTIEVGTTLSGSKTFTWSIDEGTGTVSTIDIYDVTAGATLLAGTANDGTQAVTITSVQLNSNGAVQQWKGIANNTDPVETVDSSNFTVTGRYYRFYGPASAEPSNSTEVRALASSAFHTGSTTFTLNTGTTEINFYVALPPSVTITSVTDLDALNADLTAEYVLIGTIGVLDAGSTSRSYNLYGMTQAIPYSTSHRHSIVTT
jgi:hypothetical protein